MACVSPPATAFGPTRASNDFHPGNGSPRQRLGDSDVFDAMDADYVVVEELGAGLQGRVELAFDKREQTYVAIKIPTFDRREGSAEIDLRHLDCQVQSIVQERDAMRLVHHMNVLRLIRSMPGRKNHHSFVKLVMEYASNGDLFDIISQTGAMSEQSCQFYFHQLLLGLQACHAAGVVHRDIKPENILFDNSYTLKLCDFGLASILPPSEIDSAELTDIEGTQLYMAPEISSGEPFHGPPVDLWSCGVVLFIMLTGFPPFEAAEAGDSWYDLVVNGKLAKFWAAQPASIELPSQQAVDLINKLLEVDAFHRVTIKDALAHPWLGQVAQIDTTSVLQDMKHRRQQCVEPPVEDEDGLF